MVTILLFEHVFVFVLEWTARWAEVDLLRVAYQWSVVHSPDRLDPAETGRPGREQAKQYGGLGTTPVAEFAAASLGVRIGRSPYAAARLMGDAQDLHHRHPMLWARVQALEVRASYARHVVSRTRGIYLWQDPYGAHHLVDHTGTRHI